jgi:outer membrane protein assembly factor BamB
VVILEFLNRISFFSILTWGFFFISAVCALFLTTLHSPLLRRYRPTLLATATSAIVLGILTWSTPVLLSHFGPDQSRLTPIDQLSITEWIEPVSNPETDVPPDEIAFARELGVRFKFKLNFSYELQAPLSVSGDTITVLDKNGQVHGFNAYTGLNHWMIPLRVTRLIGKLESRSRLYILEETSLHSLRVSCLDLKSPALLWQRTIPRTREGAMNLDLDSQHLIISAGDFGIWAIKTKTGEVAWKRPELYSKTLPVVLEKRIFAFEPGANSKTGLWQGLNPANGKTEERIRSSETDLRWTVLPIQEGGPAPVPGVLLAMPDSTRILAYRPRDLSLLWNVAFEEGIAGFATSGAKELFVLRASNLLESRSLLDGTLRWQKKLSGVVRAPLHVSPDGKWIGVHTKMEGESEVISFYQGATGDYRVSARTSEPLFDFQVFGDWIYLLSENHLWAFRSSSN